jgi:hypothetical protein
MTVKATNLVLKRESADEFGISARGQQVHQRRKPAARSLGKFTLRVFAKYSSSPAPRDLAPKGGDRVRPAIQLRIGVTS